MISVTEKPIDNPINSIKMFDYIQVQELDSLFTEEYQKDFISDIAEIELQHTLTLGDTYNGHIIINKRIRGKALRAINVTAVKFYNCQFEDCDLTGCLFWMAMFQKCSFENCKVDRTVFRKCEVNDTVFIRCSSKYGFTISESYMDSTSFERCDFEGIEVSGTDTHGTMFFHCSLDSGRYHANFAYRENLKLIKLHHQLDDESQKLLNSKKVFDDVVFQDCLIYFMDFRMMDFIDTKFWHCEIYKCSFTHCTLYKYNFDNTNNLKSWGSNSIDLTSLAESYPLSARILKKLFNIDSKLQTLAKETLKEKVISSIFISYSFKDAAIAKAINNYLTDEGVTTFLWERDAPGGEPLKKIMKSNIDKNDRLLFLASEHSLRSEACQYELSEGRKKQNNLWGNLFFPIHLDNFLFEVEYEQIRPREKREEYWANIQDLREVNSLDFSEFKNGIGRKKKKFEILMEKLISSLHI